ncbi:SDR family NAD(P)-dependent oxidoreductase [Acidicapsa dinghuensis]|uniref:SDR family NAD(P)-dependent oxidoreductase n=1 Tax=Acidicapsa dinghuensis TaxID=2218256 RepID=A0ABW1ELF5_9BACT|nr:SDR family NAD(P)-dependent oxidoreductase [Acidicapsa dinghuensis]
MGELRYAQYPSLNRRRVLITGGASGIGEAFVEAFAGQGAQVAFCDIDDAAGNVLAERLEAHGPGRLRYWHCDLTDLDAVRAFVAEAVEWLGGLDVLLNNAANDRRHALEAVTPEMWDALMAVNLRHQFFVTQAALPVLRQSKAASIVQMSSIAWMIPSTGLPVYVAAKAAIAAMSRSLARELGKDGIRVNAICPGAIATEKQRKVVLTAEYEAQVLAAQSLKRMLEPEEVARLALFLAADDSAGITGQCHIIDAGWV